MSEVKMEMDWDEQRLWEVGPWIRPVVIGSITVTILLMLIVGFSKSAWTLLGVEPVFVDEDYYHVWAFVLILGTTLGLAIWWAAGSAVAFYVMTFVGFPVTWTTLRLAMSIVYLGLGPVFLLAHHILYGERLWGMPRIRLKEWLATNYSDAYWLLIYGHPVVDFSVIFCGILFFGTLWKYGDRLQRSPLLETTLTLSIIGTSFAVALSLAIHSILVHIRIGA
jgi:hypothetical protein